jgi:cobalamin biosynthesis protein CobW
MEGEEQHDHDDFITFMVPLTGKNDKASLLARIEKTIAAHDILRIKGFANIADSASRLLVQAVGPRLNCYFDRPWAIDEIRQTRLVVIGEKNMDQIAIKSMLQG